LPQLQELCAAEGFPRFTAKQLCDWLYKKRVESIDAMTNLSLAQRARLNEMAYIGRETPVRCQVSRDGTKKYLFPVLDGHYIEAVYIPEEDRATLCVSCQVGCKMGCRFCVTGQQGFHGNLGAGDILNQLFSIPEYGELTNVVFMGMGEPMDNLDAILAATQTMTSDWGLGWSPKRITVSTVGIVPGLKRFLDESQCHVAVSLHNAVPQERLQMMPVQKAFPLSEVLALLRHYDWSGQRRLSFEYTMFRGINDDQQHAQKLVDALKGLDCRVNLIRFHESPEAPYKTSMPTAIKDFQDYLNRHGVICTLRASRGQDIDAACGLLAGRSRD
jgi:23S rRNA (adenine2503-C2)-methyltransferase